MDRTTERAALHHLCQHADDGPVLAVVSGIGGVGKTALAVGWLRELDGFADGELFADLRAHAPQGAAPPTEILPGFVRSLGVEHVPHTPDEQSALFRTLTSGRRLVVLLDDAASADQVRPLLPSGPSVTVVTSRRRLPGLTLSGAHPIQVDPLDTEAAVELLASTVRDGRRVDHEPEQARALAQQCAGLPLAVCIVGALLASRPNQALAAMARDLETRRLRALAIQGDVSMTSTLDSSYAALLTPAARLYRFLGLYPGSVFSASLAAAVLADDPGADAEPLLELEILLTANLLTEADGDGPRLRLLDPVREHAAERARREEPLDAQSRALRRMYDYYLHSASDAESVLEPHREPLPHDYGPALVRGEDFKGDETAALAWLETERANLMAMITSARAAGFPAYQLVDDLWGFWLLRPEYAADARAAHTEGLAAARAAGDAKAIGRMLTSTGLVEREWDPEHSMELLSEALDFFRERGDTLYAARTLNYLGHTYRDLGRREEAVRVWAQAVAECHAVEDRRTAGLAHYNLGSLAAADERYEEAAAHASTAVWALEDVGDTFNTALAQTLWGQAASHLGARDQAETLLLSALDTLRRKSDRLRLADTLTTLGDMHLRHDDAAKAVNRYQEALELYTALPEPTTAADLEARISHCTSGDGANER